jgi:hypothetical protein
LKILKPGETNWKLKHRYLWLLAKNHERSGRISLALEDYSKCKELLLDKSISLIYGETLNKDAISSKMKNLKAQEYLLKVESFYKNGQYSQVVDILNPIFSPEPGEDDIVDLSKKIIFGDDNFQRRVDFHQMFFDVSFYQI